MTGASQDPVQSQIDNPQTAEPQQDGGENTTVPEQPEQNASASQGDNGRKKHCRIICNVLRPPWDRLKARSAEQWIAIGTWALAVITVAVLIDTRRASERQLELMRHTEITQLRAYVFVKNSEIRDFGSEKPITAIIGLKNFGATPAYRLRRRIIAFAGPFPFDKFPPVIVGKYESDLGPGGEVDLGTATLSMVLTPGQIAELKAGRWAVYALGAIRYFDAFDNLRCTTFRYLVRQPGDPIAPGTYPLTHAEEGNQSDKNCTELEEK